MRPCLLSAVLAALLMPAILPAQRTQTIKGRVSDADTRQPLAGASVVLLHTDPPIGAISDAAGTFRLERVPVGRQTLRCTYAGYSSFVTDLVVTSAKEATVEILLTETAGDIQAAEVLITAREYPSRPANDASVLSARSFSAEETQRFAASANDPGRLALSFPGVQQGGDDSENDIIIRGSSSFGMLWRLEGIDIPNPNHFARPGTSGGGITVFSTQLLSTTDFSAGAMPAEYGNAISGAMDVHFRKGNMDRREYRFRAGLLGLDFSAEGPIRRGQASYLVNYRYSTLSILNDLGFHLVGERVDNDFQDLSFNLALDSRDGKGYWTCFGMGGLSLEHYRPVEDPLARTPGRSDHWEDRYQGSNMAAGGITYTRLLGEKSTFKWVLAGMGSDIFRRYDTLDLADDPYRYNTEQYYDSRIATSLAFTHKFSARTRLKTGLQLNQIWFSFYKETAPRRSTSSITEEERIVSIDGQGQTQTAQVYAQLSHRFSEQLSLHAGVHAMGLMLNRTGIAEPRVSLQYLPASRHRFSVAYGLHSQMLPLGSYFYVQQDTLPGGQVLASYPNRELPFVRAHHFIAAYNLLIGKSLRLMAEAYAMRLFQVPVRPEAGSVWWMLNSQAGVAEFPFASEGRGLNYGLDLSLEKFFDRGLFFLLNYSRFESTYQLPDGRTFNTRFGTGFASSGTAGKEFYFRKKGNVLQIGARMLYNGGFRYTPHDPVLSAERGGYVPLESQSWAEQVRPYFRIDSRIAWRINKRGYTSIVSLDIQNVLNKPNTNNVGYDAVKQELYFRNHPSGLIPVIAWEMDF